MFFCNTLLTILHLEIAKKLFAADVAANSYHDNLNCDRIFRAKHQLSLIPLNRTAALPAALSNLTRPCSNIYQMFTLEDQAGLNWSNNRKIGRLNKGQSNSSSNRNSSNSMQ